MKNTHKAHLLLPIMEHYPTMRLTHSLLVVHTLYLAETENVNGEVKLNDSDQNRLNKTAEWIEEITVEIGKMLKEGPHPDRFDRHAEITSRQVEKLNVLQEMFGNDEKPVN